jgi:hypothetical protein
VRTNFGKGKKEIDAPILIARQGFIIKGAIKDPAQTSQTQILASPRQYGSIYCFISYFIFSLHSRLVDAP